MKTSKKPQSVFYLASGQTAFLALCQQGEHIKSSEDIDKIFLRLLSVISAIYSMCSYHLKKFHPQVKNKKWIILLLYWDKHNQACCRRYSGALSDYVDICGRYGVSPTVQYTYVVNARFLYCITYV
jgi:hypothetical protein